MEEQLLKQVQKQLSYAPKSIEKTLQLLEDGNTIPFIARYRKEQTGSLDEVAIQTINDTYKKVEELQLRKQSVLKAIEEQGQLTEHLKQSIIKASTLSEVEDLYRPYKQKRRTKATIAKENGLAPLAKVIATGGQSLNEVAHQYLNDKVKTEHEALEGALEIIIEAISEEASIRQWLKKYLWNKASLHSEKKKQADDEKNIFNMYYDFTESVKQLVAHRILALNRGEKEKILTIQWQFDEAYVKKQVQNQLCLGALNEEHQQWMERAITESLKRFILPSIQREIRNELTERAETQAIEVFGDNLKQLLLQAPIKDKVVMGFDPAYRTGCKLAIVDGTGKVLAIDVIYPTASPKQDIPKAKEKLLSLIEKYNVDIIAIGNGTASRESEQFVAESLGETSRKVLYTIVSEAGASVYSASSLAREEFPDLQVEQRSAVSIARRLQDPLSELIKIDPKAVGVGQYQHDVNQKALAKQLDFIVDTAVNQVGVDVNTASPSLLMHVSGLNKTIAHNIVAYRDENGPFENRKEIQSVKRLGPKTYEQAIGFLRIPNAENPLDNTEIHPESYDLARKVLQTLNISENDLSILDTQQFDIETLQSLSQSLDTSVMMLQDIIESLKKRGRDLREQMPQPLLRADVLSIEDLKVGMELQGTVRNVVDFGAFVDIGVKQDGLVHLSKLSKRYVKHPSEIVSVGDIITVWIEKVDIEHQRISLTMIEPNKTN